ncbi:hypothetical protein CQ14_02650 [Bradyrhizobium lablabi]|uniref:Uncharacterized protein n=1 Tax=Bradyrhizobium lablabi TaxID=722472 RepID=A0A0R3N807_9BRAD|nr:hypothetical protein [Bradyrhizobium lablabi]KRR26415.1 hypothetical protein CQ14_02650 [Bradyrhizobium lablabi]
MDAAVQQSENGFFKYVWRFNALAIAGAATTCILLGLYAGLTIFKEETRSRRVTNVVNVDPQDKISEEFSLGTPRPIVATTHVQVPLFRAQSYSAGSVYSKESRQQVNLLFLNVSSNESRWLFDGVGQLLLDSHMLFNKLKDAPDQPRAAVAVLHVVVERDTNGDKRLTERDAVSLATSATDGTNYRKLIEGIDQLYTVQQIADDKVLVLYQKNRETISELYGVPSMVPLMQASVPKVNLN